MRELPRASRCAMTTAALDRVRIVLVDTSHPGNIGAAARALHTMGLARLILVRPRQFPHPDATARASGATAILEHARATLEAMRFLNPAMPRRLMPRLRRLFARSGLEKEEINILRGILARVDELIARNS